jgi:hypothetical protein
MQGKDTTISAYLQLRRPIFKAEPSISYNSKSFNNMFTFYWQDLCLS